MIEFRKKKSLVQNLIPEIVEHLKKEKISFTPIKEEDADEVSRVNSKAMVIRSCTKTEYGYYQIQVQDKELYNYTQKLIKDIFQMRITSIDKKSRIVTAECDYKGRIIDIIEILGMNPKYNLSIVV